MRMSILTNLPITNIEEYGRALLEEHDVVSKRVFDIAPSYLVFTTDTLRNIIRQISHFCIDDVTYYVERRVHGAGDFIDWSLDEAILANLECDDQKSESPRDAPVFTMIMFESNYGTDFEGGTIEFIDGTVVEPIAGKYVLFDSREVYRMNTITVGEQKSLFVRFYA